MANGLSVSISASGTRCGDIVCLIFSASDGLISRVPGAYSLSALTSSGEALKMGLGKKQSIVC